jgi:outer membrane lipopolysaccharide assembly protein LptE/RlpB
MRTLLIAAASLGFSIAAASACDFHDSSTSAKADTPDPMTVASVNSSAPMSKATGEAAKKLAQPGTQAPASKSGEATE